MMLTLWTGSVLGKAAATSAWPDFVIGDANLFVRVHHAFFLFQSGGHTFDRFVEFVDADRGLLRPCGQQARPR